MKSRRAAYSVRTKENFRATKKIVLLWTILFAVYSGLLLIEGLFFAGDLYVSKITLLAGTALMVAIFVILALYPHKLLIAFMVGSGTQLTFLFAGSYLQELDFYFFAMFLVVCIISMLKSFKLLLICVSILVLVDIFALVFIMSRFQWLDLLRFTTQFVLCFFGYIFLLIQTYNVSQKDGRSERAMAAFSSLLRSTPDMVAITDNDKRVLYMSDQMAEFFGCPRKEYAVKQPLVDIISGKRMKAIFADILDADGFFQTINEIEVEGKKRFFNVISDRLSGEAEGMYINMSDITTTIEAQIAAEEANKSKTGFLATMSHEIRTPLNAIIGASGIELDREGHLPETVDSLSIVNTSGKMLLGIINDILDLSKIETGNFELMPINYDTPGLINDTTRLNSMRIGDKPITFEVNIAETLPSLLFGDELRIKQILNNILSNAIKYTENGLIRFTVESLPIDSDNITLVFTVQDTGQGMTEEQLKTIYDKYTMFNQEANRKTEGAGLGMSITKNLIDMMGGKIVAESKPGKGSKFTIHLNQQVREVKSIGKEVAERLQNFKLHDKAQKTEILREYMPYGKILIVDDVNANLFVAKGLMKPYGLVIETALSGYEAIEKIQSGCTYDIVFMDHMMPLMDGIEATRLIREAGYIEPIVALTANAIVGQREAFLKSGFDDFLSKPIDVIQLNEVLNRLVRDKQSAETISSANQQKKESDLDNANVESAADNADEYANLILALKDIEELDVVSALDAMSGLSDVYVDTVKLTASLLPKRIANMDEHIKSDIRAFVVEVHGLKNVLKTIGASEPGNSAAKLEKAALERNTVFCSGFYPEFRDVLVQLQLNLESALPGSSSDVKEAAESRSIIPIISEVKAATEVFDRDFALNAILPLMEFTYSAEIDCLLNDIVSALGLFDCECALEKIIELEEKV
ncbi:MAG: ATP-binding protein [Oscillospiraceae bacterium]|nr:ATP-binding protein [Oscillospiraceae bacterium]